MARKKKDKKHYRDYGGRKEGKEPENVYFSVTGTVYICSTDL
jgi:hypothetical protein